MHWRRGFSQKSKHEIGNFWVDITRSVLYLFLPLSFIFAILLMSQGVIQNLNASIHSIGMEGVEQIIPMGPAALKLQLNN